MAQLYKYHLNAESASILKECVSGMWDWIEPRHPEDLSFIREDGTPWFVSISHEHDAFFTATQQEVCEIERVLGQGSLRFDCVDERPDERY
jgi:hypothetical protein